jgi:hypothetical protein
MSPLERRCRLLLRAYPAAYRRDRGDESLGKLLEVTPAGRSWPRARDARSLTFAGLRERAAHNSRLTTAANVRTAALIGVAAYLTFSIAGYLSVLIVSELETGRAELSPAPAGEIVVASLLAVTVVLAWVSRRRVLVLAGAVPAAAAVCYAGPWRTWLIGGTITLLICLAALTVLAGGTERPSRRWLWLIGAVAAVQFLPSVGPAYWPEAHFSLLVAVAGACIVWAAFDARPAITLALAFLLSQLPTVVDVVRLGGVIGPQVPLLAVLCASSPCWRCGDCARSRHTAARHETQWWRATSFPDEGHGFLTAAARTADVRRGRACRWSQPARCRAPA